MSGTYHVLRVFYQYRSIQSAFVASQVLGFLAKDVRVFLGISIDFQNLISSIESLRSYICLAVHPSDEY